MYKLNKQERRLMDICCAVKRFVDEVGIPPDRDKRLRVHQVNLLRGEWQALGVLLDWCEENPAEDLMMPTAPVYDVGPLIRAYLAGEPYEVSGE